MRAVVASHKQITYQEIRDHIVRTDSKLRQQKLPVVVSKLFSPYGNYKRVPDHRRTYDADKMHREPVELRIHEKPWVSTANNTKTMEPHLRNDTFCLLFFFVL